MKFDIVTIFPEIFDSYFSESILARAQKNKLLEIKIHNLREFAMDKHKTTDDTPYGGGAGMVMKVEPIYESIKSIKLKAESYLPSSFTKVSVRQAGETEKLKIRTILFSAKGKKYTQSDVKRLSEYDNLILICGRYEGVDERVAKHLVDEEISIGEYVLTGGEIPAMVVVDSVARLIPGVLGNDESIKSESHSSKGYLKHPQYTKPEEFQDWKVPKVLLSGNHKKIEEWRKKNSKK